MAKAARKQKIEAAEQKVGQDRSMEMPATGTVQEMKRTDQIVEVVDGPDIKHRVEQEAFMNEVIEVMVHESTDPNADNPVMVACQGVTQYFVRGATQPVKRKFVEVLARAKQTSIKTPEITNAQGSRAIRIDRNTALRYPFSIMGDKNPNGGSWLKKILAEA